MGEEHGFSFVPDISHVGHYSQNVDMLLERLCFFLRYFCSYVV